ncbi:hypothetical protein HN51_049634, partial [Arachis hypogaea]
MERMIREEILQVHSDMLERLHLRIPTTVLDNPMLTLYRFDHRAMKHGWLQDEDYDPEADKVESFDDHVDDLFSAHEVERQGTANSKKKDTDYWVVDVI